MTERKKPPTIDEMCESLKAPTTTLLDIVKGAGNVLLMDMATTVFGPFLPSQQTTTLALMLGMVLAEVEGKATILETLGGTLVTKEDRLKLFMATFEKSYELAMQDRLIYERDNPTAPDVPTVN